MPQLRRDDRLAALGWDLSAVADYCHLDHAQLEPGYRKQMRDKHGQLWEIVLCPDDAIELEDGAWEGDYSGARTPVSSMATEWPWYPVAEAAAG